MEFYNAQVIRLGKPSHQMILSGYTKGSGSVHSITHTYIYLKIAMTRFSYCFSTFEILFAINP